MPAAETGAPFADTYGSRPSVDGQRVWRSLEQPPYNRPNRATYRTRVLSDDTEGACDTVCSDFVLIGGTSPAFPGSGGQGPPRHRLEGCGVPAWSSVNGGVPLSRP